MLAPPSNRLVVVDDDPHVLQALRFAFEMDGYEVRTFSSAEELLAAPPREPHTCFLIDERLPGASGLETVSRLRAEGVLAPAILMTTHPPPALRRQAAAAGIEIVEKPLLGEVLAQRVRAALAD